MGNLQSVNHLRGYLFKTAKNIATDWVRQRIVREAYVQDEPLRGNREAASPEDIWLAREELEALEQNVDNLPPKCRYALIMVRLEGASYEEVAEQRGIKTHSARRLVERAMEYLLEKKVWGRPRGKPKNAPLANQPRASAMPPPMDRWSRKPCRGRDIPISTAQNPAGWTAFVHSGKPPVGRA